MDSIIVRDLRVKAHVGVTEQERSDAQLLVISVELYTDLRRAGMSDDLNDTVDYGRVTAEIEELVTATETALLESLAEKIAGHIAAMPGTNGVSVEIAKDAPPIDQEVGCVAVRIERL
jgi:dihydroneopterin aldolase